MNASIRGIQQQIECRKKMGEGEREKERFLQITSVWSDRCVFEVQLQPTTMST